MTIDETRRDHLLRTIEWARKIEDRLAPLRAQHAGRVHFRPSSAGIAMVGLLPDRPQRGKSSITDLGRLAAEFAETFRIHCVDCEQGRPTPEKRLQSHLIAEAYRHDRQLRPLAAPDLASPLRFITDELALPTADGRIVCDLLALHDDRPVVIELKPGREKQRLVEQVTTYAALIETNLELFSALYSAILGHPTPLRAPCERWIVWPHRTIAGRDPQEQALAALGIRVVGYEAMNDSFRFHVGRAVAQTHIPPARDTP